MFPAVGINIGDLIKLKMEKAGISAPPTFLDLSDFLRADTFLKMPEVMGVIWKCLYEWNLWVLGQSGEWMTCGDAW